MVQIKIPWAAWTDSIDFILTFPDSWNVQTCPIHNAEDIADTAIQESILNPIGTKRISEIAKGKKTAAIVVDDISRLTPVHRILPTVIEELEKAGISKEHIVIILAIGAHRPMVREDMIKKLGELIVNTMNIQNHHPYENLVDLGVSKIGTPIHVNKTYYEADVKIAVGGVIPHPLAGFGGGAKIVLPGVCGIETLAANHRTGLEGGGGLGYITEVRKDIEEIAETVRLDFSINVVLTMRGGIAGIYSGHYIEAHRKAMDLGKNLVYVTKIPPPGIDIGIFNLFPEDTEMTQAIKGFNFILAAKKFLKRDATVVFTSACTEGRGYHSLMSEPGAKLYVNWENHIIWNAIFQKRKFAFFSPNLNESDIHHFFPKSTIFSTSWDTILQKLRQIHGDSPNVAVFPCSIQVPE
jgi:nickel-dependent lactate racemase